MKNKTFDQLLSDALSKESNLISPLNLEKVKDNIPQFSNEKLCEMIVCEKYFGFEEKVSPFCMEELSKRRLAGDTFQFEEYINQAYKSLPVLNFTLPDIRNVWQQAMSLRSKK